MFYSFAFFSDYNVRKSKKLFSCTLTSAYNRHHEINRIASCILWLAIMQVITLYGDSKMSDKVVSNDKVRAEIDSDYPKAIVDKVSIQLARKEPDGYFTALISNPSGIKGKLSSTGKTYVLGSAVERYGAIKVSIMVTRDNK